MPIQTSLQDISFSVLIFFSGPVLESRFCQFRYLSSGPTWNCGMAFSSTVMQMQMQAHTQMQAVVAQARPLSNLTRPSGPHLQCYNHPRKPEISSIGGPLQPCNNRGKGAARSLSMLPLSWITEKATTFCDARRVPRAPPTQQYVLDQMPHSQEPLGEHPRTCIVIQAPVKDSIEVHDGAGRPRWQITTSTTSSLQLRTTNIPPQ